MHTRAPTPTSQLARTISVLAGCVITASLFGLVALGLTGEAPLQLALATPTVLPG